MYTVLSILAIVGAYYVAMLVVTMIIEYVENKP